MLVGVTTEHNLDSFEIKRMDMPSLAHNGLMVWICIADVKTYEQILSIIDLNADIRYCPIGEGTVF